MAKTISALTGRTQFDQIMSRVVEQQERFLVDHRGEPAVIIMSVGDFFFTTSEIR